MGGTRPVAVESNWEHDWGSELEGGVAEEEFESEEYYARERNEGPMIAPPLAAAKGLAIQGSNYGTYSKERLTGTDKSMDELPRLPSADKDKVLKSAPMKQAHKGVASTDMAVRFSFKCMPLS